MKTKYSIKLKIENTQGDVIETVTGDTASECVYQAVLAIVNKREANLNKQLGILYTPKTSISLKAQKDTVKVIVQQLNQQCAEQLEALQNIINTSLKKEKRIAWEDFKSHSLYNIKEPIAPTLKKIPVEPKATEERYQATLSLFDILSSSRKKAKEEIRKQNFQEDFNKWKREKEAIEAVNDKLLKEHQDNLDKWRKGRDDFMREQIDNNAKIDKFSKTISQGERDAIIFWYSKILKILDCQVNYTKNNDVEYDPTAKLLIVDFELPAPDDISKLKTIKFNQAQETINEVLLGDKDHGELYDKVIYQIVLLTINEIFKRDNQNAIDAVVLNGWVNSIDKASGNEVRGCILSIQTSRIEFSKINLSQVDPKSCFHALKGIGSSTLHSLASIAPIASINREDKRFIQSHEVAEKLDEGSNLAAMDWEEFEHLIRELFEKEFQKNGGEVKITQASRDGGVDAVAFDPDPIRGGKIIIQAKRYTNVVGVSAVRDLYGTILNEGATKGILVTTSNYGSDAYEFAKGKPITLMNGNNLLYLLGKYGYKAKIDLQEAKKTLKQSDNLDNQ